MRQVAEVPITFVILHALLPQLSEFERNLVCGCDVFRIGGNVRIVQISEGLCQFWSSVSRRMHESDFHNPLRRRNLTAFWAVPCNRGVFRAAPFIGPVKIHG